MTQSVEMEMEIVSSNSKCDLPDVVRNQESPEDPYDYSTVSTHSCSSIENGSNSSCVNLIRVKLAKERAEEIPNESLIVPVTSNQQSSVNIILPLRSQYKITSNFQQLCQHYKVIIDVYL